MVRCGEKFWGEVVTRYVPSRYGYKKGCARLRATSHDGTTLGVKS